MASQQTSRHSPDPTPASSASFTRPRCAKIIDFVLKQSVSKPNSEKSYPPQLSATLRGIDDLGDYGTSPCAGSVPTHDQANGEASFLGSAFQCALCRRGLCGGAPRPS